MIPSKANHDVTVGHGFHTLCIIKRLKAISDGRPWDKILSPRGVFSYLCPYCGKLYEPLKRTLNHIHERRTSWFYQQEHSPLSPLDMLHLNLSYKTTWQRFYLITFIRSYGQTQHDKSWGEWHLGCILIYAGWLRNRRGSVQLGRWLKGRAVNRR